MLLLFTLSGFFASFVFLAAVATFVFALRFFVDSRRRLVELFPDLVLMPRLLPSGFVSFGSLPSGKATEKTAGGAPLCQKAMQPTGPADSKEIAILYRRLQQHLNEARKPLVPAERKKEDGEAQPEGTAFGWQQPDQQEAFAEKLEAQFEEVQGEVNKLWEKMRRMGQETRQAAGLVAQLKQAGELQWELETTLLRKEERLQELTQENQQLHELLDDLRERHSQTAFQRQQLLKKTKYLEVINADLQQAAKADGKLKAKITRVAELESMLELMTGGK